MAYGMPQLQGMVPSPKCQRSRIATTAYTNQRSSPRLFVVCPISITTPSGTTHGIVRDISAGGIFFYSKFSPSLEMNIEFTLTFNDKNISGKGEVVRIEQGAPHAAVGVALKVANSDDWPNVFP